MVKSNIFFSIIIPTYNQDKYLEKCIESCLSQTYKFFEIIIVDNNSNDSTNRILEKYKDKIVIRKINNYGIISKSRNLALEISKGNWIALLDSDDYFFPNKLEEAKNAILKYDFDVFSSSEILFNKEKNFYSIALYGNKSQNLYLDMIKYGNCLSTSASIVKKNFIEQNSIIFSEEEQIKNIADYDFFLKIAKFGGKFFFFNKPLGFHLFHSESTTTSSQNTYFGALKKLLNDHYKMNFFSKDHYLFSLINLKVLELIMKKNLNLLNRLILLLKIFVQNPSDTFFILNRIIIKKVKNIVFNLLNKNILIKNKK